jgi:NADH-quinone oxidoreductase subunit D
MAIETLSDIRIPERAEYIRTILCEISRINSHLYAFELTANAGGGYPAVFLWTVADRELFLDLAEMLTGARWAFSFFIPGGVRRDIPKGFKKKVSETLDYFSWRLEIYRESWLKNVLFQIRSKNVGHLPINDAVSLGATGPCLRGSSVSLDVRKDEPYASYDKISFDVITQLEGDSYARMIVRYLEMIESVKIIRQAVEEIPDGPIKKTGVSPNIPPGETYSRVETARGEIGVHLITDGSEKPYRIKINSPSLRNLFVLSKLPEVSNILMADLPVILWSFDPWFLDADR